MTSIPAPTRPSWNNPHAWPRTPLLARAVVVAAQPLAAQAGLGMLAQGGTAADAAIAAAATLMVVEPTSSGLGADAFALVWDGSVHALNASGCSPSSAVPPSPGNPVPALGWPSVTVPGAVEGWLQLWKRFGRLPFASLFEPAIRYAETGYLVSPLVSRVWRGLAASSRSQPELWREFYPAGRGPEVGALVRMPALGRSLRLVAASLGRDLYEGELADRIGRHAEATGGALARRDLAAHRSEWTKALSISFGGHELHEMPPNSQGLAALIALGILQHLGLDPGETSSVDTVHLQVEATRLALEQTHAHVADPRHMSEPAEALLTPSALAGLARKIDTRRARGGGQSLPARPGGTSYLCAADAQGMVVSYIQSSGPGFGAGIVVPDTGIALQSRAAAFSADPNHPNAYGPAKRPFHTNCPAMLTVDGHLHMAFGLMGWSMQPQAHVQFVCRAVLGGESPQAIIDAPRWRIASEEHALLLEPPLAHAIGAGLAERGHQLVDTERFMPAATPFGSHLMFGGAGLVATLADGYAAAADPRRDGAAVGL